MFSPSVVSGSHRPWAGDRLRALSVLALSFPSLSQNSSLLPRLFQPHSSLDILLPLSRSCYGHRMGHEMDNPQLEVRRWERAAPSAGAHQELRSLGGVFKPSPKAARKLEGGFAQSKASLFSRREIF